MLNLTERNVEPMACNFPIVVHERAVHRNCIFFLLHFSVPTLVKNSNSRVDSLCF